MGQSSIAEDWLHPINFNHITQVLVRLCRICVLHVSVLSLVLVCLIVSTTIDQRKDSFYLLLKVVAVGTGITPSPPHRPVRAELPHTVPTSGHNVPLAAGHWDIPGRCLPYSPQRTLQAFPALRPALVLLRQIALGLRLSPCAGQKHLWVKVELLRSG